MTNLNDIIEQKAKEHAEGTCTGKQYGGTTDLIVPKIKEWAAYDFTSGASFATTDPLILQSLLQPFGDWLWRNYKQIDAQVWKERYVPSEKCYTIYQVIGNYIQHLQTTQPK